MRNLYFLFLCFFISVAAFAQIPANDSCESASLLLVNTVPQYDTFRIAGATSDTTGCRQNEDVWFKFEMPATGGIRILGQRVQLNHNLNFRLYEGTCGSLTTYACTGTCNYYSTGNCGTELYLKDPSLYGDTLYIRASKFYSFTTGDTAAIAIEHILDAEFPSNDLCGAATDITTSLYTTALDTLSLNNALVETNMSSCGEDQDIWVKFEVPTSGGFEMVTDDLNNNWNQFFRVFTGGCASLSEYVCNGTCDDFNATGNCGDFRRIIDPSIAGDTVWVQLTNRFGPEAPDSFSLSIKEIAAADIAVNDSCGAATDITTSLYSTDLDTLNLKNAIVETSLGTCGIDEDIWVKFEVPSSGGFEMSTSTLTAGNYDEFIRVYTGGCASLSDYVCDGTCDYYNAATNCGDSRTIIDPSLAGDTVWVRLANRFSIDDRDSFTLSISEIASVDVLANDSCGSALDISSNFGMLDTFTLKNAIHENNLYSCGEKRDVWFKFEVPSNGGFEIETGNLDVDYNQYFRVYQGGCASLSPFDCSTGNCQKTQSGNCGDFLRVVDSSLAGDTVLLRVSNRFNFSTLDSFTLALDSFTDAELKINDDCINATHLNVTTGNCAIDTFDNMNSTFSEVPTGACAAYVGADVWFAFEMPASDDVFISMEQVDAVASGFRIVAYSGGCPSLVEQDCNSAGSFPDLSLRNLGLAGDTVYLQVYRSNNNEVGDTFGICVKDTVIPALRTTVGQYEKTASCDVLSGSGWFDMVDTTGNLVMSIDPNGSYLGRTCFGINIEDSSSNIRTATDTLGNEALLGPRNWFINPVSNSGAIVRLYYKERELEIWRDSLANRGISVGSSLEEFYQDSMRISKTDGESLTDYLGSNPVQINPTVIKVRDSIIMAEFTVTSFSNFITVFNPGNISAPVPVEWVSFTGYKRNDIVTLDWATASELNCSHFEIQRSFDGNDYNVIGIEEGQGTKNGITHYNVNDPNSTNRVTYYRLKQIDYDGHYEYSNVVVIASEKVVQVSPNPFSDKLEVSAGGEEIVKLEILDMYGRMVFQKAINDKSAAINLSTEIDHGMYILRITTVTGVIEKKIVKK